MAAASPPRDSRALSREALLKCWIAMERFGTTTLGGASRLAGGRLPGRVALDLEPGHALPWEPGHPVAAQAPHGDNVEWRHTLHIGQFELGGAYGAVEAQFPPAELEEEERIPVRGMAPLLAVTLTSDGRPLVDSLQVSSAAWSIARTLRVGVGKARWLSGFEEDAEDVRDAFARLMTEAARGPAGAEAATDAPATETDGVTSPVELGVPASAVVPPSLRPATADAGDDDEAIDEDGLALAPITWDVLMRLMGLARKILELDEHVVIRPVVRGTSWQENKRSPLGGGDTLLNSFTVADLERVAREVGTNRPPQALGRYLDSVDLAEDEAEARVDLDEDFDALRALTLPARTPAGRWPTPAASDLALGQQVAVNLALDPEGPSVVAVNGPPGTGKTTMLRDLVAGVVTERAKAIAKLAKPSDMFELPTISSAGDSSVTTYRLKPGIAGHELLLACATNAAAQNVSLELPASGAIDHEWVGRPGYLADFATAALRAAAQADARDDVGAPRGARPPAPPAIDAWGFVAARLGRRSYGKAFAEAVWWGAPPWQDRARADAPSERSAKGLSKLLMEGTVSDHTALWEKSRDRFNAALGVVEALRADRADAAVALAPLDALEGQLTLAEQALEAALATVETHQARREELAEKVKEQIGSGATKSAKRSITLVRETDEAIAAAQVEAEAAREAVVAAEAVVARRVTGAGGDGDADGDDTAEASPWVVPDEAWEADRAARELRAPWSDEAWNRARTECFLAALDLHEATLRAVQGKARQNLRVVFDLLTGRVGGLSHAAVLAAWQTLFLVVPVISTTFASLPTLLAGLREEDLGWLMIDEAGQAEPQQAVGALWRCRRAVIVGDPLQLEPVTSLPRSLAEAIRAHYEVPHEYVGAEASVQRLADAVMPWGAERGEEDLWVGVPMNVHRRCEPAIFELVNAIAYRGAMVNATQPRPAHPALQVQTCWLDVPERGRGSDGHWRPGEGERLDLLLAHLHRHGYDFRELFAVSPFRDVARRLRQRADHPAHAGMTGGTVHTIQGREADTVILVLGSAPGSEGARRWASAKPNLLNVAVSRARQRLYVIGDYDAWSGLPHFRELGGLRRVAPRG